MRYPSRRPGFLPAASDRARRSPLPAANPAPLRALFLATSLALCFLGLATPGLAGDPCPLETGRQWIYQDEAGTVLTVTVAGTRLLRGRIATVLEHEVASRRDVLRYEMYCSRDDEGDLLLHGHRRLDTGETVLYDPPLLYVDLPLAAGKSWAGTTTQYDDLEGSGAGLPVRYAFTVRGVEEVDLPAGREPAFRLGLQSSPALDRWYSEGVGIVQLQPLIPLGRTFRLVSTSGSLLAEEHSWGQVKQLYR